MELIPELCMDAVLAPDIFRTSAFSPNSVGDVGAALYSWRAWPRMLFFLPGNHSQSSDIEDENDSFLALVSDKDEIPEEFEYLLTGVSPEGDTSMNSSSGVVIVELNDVLRLSMESQVDPLESFLGNTGLGASKWGVVAGDLLAGLAWEFAAV